MSHFGYSLIIDIQDTKEESYSSSISYDGGSVYSNTGKHLKLKLHDWSHACTNLNVKTIHVMVVINGMLIHNRTINSEDFTDNSPTTLQNNLLIGI